MDNFNGDELIEHILAMMTPERKTITVTMIERLRKLEPEYVEQLNDALTKVIENDAKELISLLEYGFIDKGDRLAFPPASTEFKNFIACVPAEELRLFRSVTEHSHMIQHTLLRMLVGIINRENEQKVNEIRS